MSVFTSSTPFDLTGEFGGIVFTNAGKHRLLLRLGETERLFKVPKFLRRRLPGVYRPGQAIRVCGEEEKDLLTGASKWVVAAVLPLDAVAPVPPVAAALPSGPIRVCAKKNCWRSGGCELFAALERGIEARGLGGAVKVKAVGCLDRCKQGPNIDWGDREMTRCHPADVETLLDRLAAAANRPVAVPQTVGE